MMAFALDHPAPATIFVISGDGDFSYSISTLGMRHYNMILIAPELHSSSYLVVLSAETFRWHDVLTKPSMDNSGTLNPLLHVDTTGLRTEFDERTSRSFHEEDVPIRPTTKHSTLSPGGKMASASTSIENQLLHSTEPDLIDLSDTAFNRERSLSSSMGESSTFKLFSQRSDSTSIYAPSPTGHLGHFSSPSHHSVQLMIDKLLPNVPQVRDTKVRSYSPTSNHHNEQSPHQFDLLDGDEETHSTFKSPSTQSYKTPQSPVQSSFSVSTPKSSANGITDTLESISYHVEPLLYSEKDDAESEYQHSRAPIDNSTDRDIAEALSIPEEEDFPVVTDWSHFPSASPSSSNLRIHMENEEMALPENKNEMAGSSPKDANSLEAFKPLIRILRTQHSNGRQSLLWNEVAQLMKNHQAVYQAAGVSQYKKYILKALY